MHRPRSEGTSQVQATVIGGTFCFLGTGPGAHLAPECQEQAWPGGEGGSEGNMETCILTPVLKPACLAPGPRPS